MKKTVQSLIFALSLFVGTAAFAGGVAPMDQPQRVALAAGSGAAMSSQNVRDAIVKAGQTHGWMVQSEEPGMLTLHVLVRGKHDVVVRIAYDAEGYQLTYVSSANLDYRMKNGQPYIHSSYNRWIALLMQDIAVFSVH